MSNLKTKVEVLYSMQDLLNLLEVKLGVLDALDRDYSQSDAYDLQDQLTTITKSLHSLNGAVARSIKVCGVDAEYSALFNL